MDRTHELMLDLGIRSGRQLVARVRTPEGFVRESAFVRVGPRDRPARNSGARVDLLRKIDAYNANADADEDPFLMGSGSIRKILEWIDKINEEAGNATAPGNG